MQLDAIVLDEVIDTASNVIPSTGNRADSILTETGIKTTDKKKQTSIMALDMFVLGPAMVYAGMGKELPDVLKTMMLLTGVGTILVNGAKYLKQKKMEEMKIKPIKVQKKRPL